MQEKLVVLSGISYDYCDHMVFNKIIGFLDEEQNTIVGIELNDEECNIRNLDEIKKHLLSEDKTVRYVCGTMTGNFEYYAVDFEKERIHFGKMTKRDNGEMTGNEKVFQNGMIPVVVGNFYVSCSTIEELKDEELKTILTSSLEAKKQCFAWRSFLYTVEARAMDLSPKKKILFRTVPSER